MTFIAEHIIEKAGELFDNSQQAYHATIQEIEAEEPLILAYLLSPSFKLLTEEEKHYMLYCCLVIWKSVQTGSTEERAEDSITEESLGEAEEKNWELLESVASKRFRDKLDVFFKDTPQEDLLAFIEDALADEENDDDFITKIGREPLFIGLKTIVDVLT